MIEGKKQVRPRLQIISWTDYCNVSACDRQKKGLL